MKKYKAKKMQQKNIKIKNIDILVEIREISVLNKQLRRSARPRHPRSLIKREFFCRNNAVAGLSRHERAGERFSLDVDASRWMKPSRWWDRIGLTCDIDLCVGI